jgi:phosphotransferase system  glucose/maltose/N-acetylglucosamine-specific IIC component
MYVGKTRDPVMVIVLSIITCGIYGLYWFYTTMVDLNGTLGEERLNPVLMLVVCIICTPVLYYVLYKIDQGLAEVSQKEGIYYKENFILWLLLVLLLGVGVFVAYYQITGTFNKIWAKRSGVASVQ